MSGPIPAIAPASIIPDPVIPAFEVADLKLRIAIFSLRGG
jgi:hypothetical protein